jgi:hypothetical protein
VSILVLCAACSFDGLHEPSGSVIDGPTRDARVDDARTPDAGSPDATPDANLPACATSPAYDLVHAGHAYRLVTSAVIADEAQAACGGDGAYLVTIDNSDENGFVDAIYSTGWIGANDVALEGTFVWVGGGPVTYENWASGEPNDFMNVEDCAYMTSSGSWNDVPCDDEWRYLCECPADAD